MRTNPGARPARAASQERYRRILAAVAAIPRGRVASYGQVAADAGLPRGARLVGRVLACSSGRLPWHRVVGASGRISLSPGSAGFAEQVRRLEAEGVTVRAGRVAKRHFVSPHEYADALLWSPAALAARQKSRGPAR
jgi:methylated-DNA-protein-cysteine methyltransferase-like protein